MKIKNSYSTKLLSLLLVLSLCFTMLPMSVFAAVEGSTGGGSAGKNFTLTVNAEHTHVWSDEWSGNENYHWHECIADGCDLTDSWGDGKGDYALHEFDITRDNHSPISNMASVHHLGTCKICGRNESVLRLIATRQFNDTHHWYECPCGVTQWDTFRDKDEHWFDDDADMICNYCGYDRRPLIITGGTAGTDYTYENGVLDIKAAGTYEIKNVNPAAATGDIIKVSAPSGTVNITLNGVVINVSATNLAAFEITGECTTKLILKDGSENSLDSGVDRAGIANHSHNLIITCENAENATHICSSDCGVLRAIGQHEGAGIGGDRRESGSNITITGGNIVADIVNSGGGAGIGGGYNGTGDSITISGGTVTATSETGAGIGGGWFGSGSGITISGGTVTTTSVYGAGIGGGQGGNGSNITISGGTVAATSEQGAGIGGGELGDGSNITISGGTVTATSEQSAGIGGGAGGGIAGNIKIAPAANTRIYAYNGSDNTGTDLADSPFTTETDITSLLSGNAFYSEAQCIHADTDTDHNCDFGCGETMGTHGDTDKDHACDYGCAESIGTHEDSNTDTDHLCDYGCGATLENCTDAVNDNNHSCDVCGKADVSEHTYGDATCEAPATCSECGATTGDALGHKDDNKDHTCDRGCGKTDMGTHAAATGKHTCDYCSAAVSTCKDDDENHICDICGAELTHDYSTEWKSDGTNHWHECSCGDKTDEAAHSGGTATCTDKAVCSACGVAYGELAAHTYGTEWKSDGTNHWHECSCGEKADEAAHSGGTASCTVKAACSACGVTYGELAAHTYEKGKCTVCEAVDPDYVPETDTPPTGDNSHLALWIALLFISGGAVITLTAYNRKRRI